jgi:hypothetical protein
MVPTAPAPTETAPAILEIGLLLLLAVGRAGWRDVSGCPPCSAT